MIIKKGYFPINPVSLTKIEQLGAVETLNTLDRLHDVVTRLLNQGYTVLDFNSQMKKKAVVNIKPCSACEKLPNVEIVRRPGGVKGREKVFATVLCGVQVQWTVTEH